MRRNIYIIAFVLALFSLSACEKDETKAYLSGNPAGSSLQTVPAFADFTLDHADDTLLFSWTAADFGFQASITYTLQIDSVTKNFSGPVDILTVDSLSATISVADFNKKLLDAGYEEYDTDHSFELRVKATVSTEVAPAYSTAEAITVAPYATIFPPIYMCGAATGGWDWTKGVEMRSTAPSVYNTIAYFISGEGFRFFAQPDWSPTSYNYPYFSGGSVDANLEDAGDGDNNFKVVGATGYYDITVDLKNKTIEMVEVDEPVLYMTGAALGGWDWTTNYVQLTWISNGMFEATTEFISGEAFRFFAQADWSPTSYNYPFFATDGSVDPLFEDAGDSDQNFKFTGTTGDYTIEVNMLDLIITMTPAK